ncbi:CoA-acylating methylmalonate-semialdehyde dehydrogenase [Hymenobacter caeli]|uniref:Malonate-semialdehyde dehydrogenase (Acetylating)/methylmalonate-semialdehyde dehydrogenase n=1 Tax=Hymenobacter caeli TaxID=2735894 RepID=A0ABX2FKN1_9BACT|nr:CoA-acylating methylmalonate-semialdehyde dehydrogenase [Hymenobacter caeli]NRT17693.1 malonate-semialdehyde dehydrogenase (acetylating)/methylmalonate-semialdehyde dehydrogenase [Hymenobacter caeli]
MEVQTLKYPAIQNYVAGQATATAGAATLDVFSPLDGALLSTVPVSDAGALDAAVAAAQAAFPAWSAVPIKERVQIFYRYKTLLERDVRALSDLVREENGKTYDEARAEVEKAIELTEFACSLPQLIGGEVLEVSKGVECRSERKPLGVVASIAPFNFPNMVPHWTIPNALVLGNCMVLKPSEQVPLSAVKIAELLKEAGLPDGVLNIVNGDREIVEAICDHPGIKAVSFVGSTKIAKVVYIRATGNLKRCVALGGAKNHLLVLPDANPDMTAANVAASMSGCAGQRCMAGSTMVGVGAIDHIVRKLVEEARKIVPGQNLGAVISRAAKARIEQHIDEAEAAGAKILLDGRHAVVPGHEDGYYVGPTVIDYVTPDMRIAREEVFGPVLAILRTTTLDEALALENASPYGNAAAVFTQSGSHARYVMDHASAGMIGINIGVPVPREPFSFGGWNESKFGACDITGKSSIEFWTQLKKTTTKWNPESRVNWMS